MVDTNEVIAVQVVLEHEPEFYNDWDGDTIQCSAKGCGHTGMYGWAKHVAEAINDHLGLWGPEEEEDEDRFANGPYGDEW